MQNPMIKRNTIENSSRLSENKVYIKNSDTLTYSRIERTGIHQQNERNGSAENI
jgi:hypothetical protein